jgi:hypothetical protein
METAARKNMVQTMIATKSHRRESALIRFNVMRMDVSWSFVMR